MADTMSAITDAGNVLLNAIGIWDSHNQTVANRKFQREENQKNRDFTKQMWLENNAYNTPSAIAARYREAGQNPYLADATVANVPSQNPSSPSTSATPSPLVDYAPLGSALRSFGDHQIMSAQSSNQRAQAVASTINSAIEIYKSMGSEAADNFIKTQAPFLKAVGIENSLQAQMWNSQLAKMQYEERIAGVKAQLEEKFGEQKAQRELWAMDQAYNESVSRVGLNAALGKVYNASESELIERAKTYASQIAANYSNAFYWEQKGLTEQQVRDYLVSHWDYTVRMLQMDYDEQEAEWSMNEGVRVAKHTKEWKSMRRGTTEWKNSRTKQFTDEVRSSLQSVPLRPARAAAKRQVSWKQRDYYNGGYVEQYGYE